MARSRALLGLYLPELARLAGAELPVLGAHQIPRNNKETSTSIHVLRDILSATHYTFSTEFTTRQLCTTTALHLEDQHQDFIQPDQPHTINPHNSHNPQTPPSHFHAVMSRLNIPLDVLTSRLNFSGRFEGMRSQSITSRFANLKPLSEFLDVKRISKPANFGEVQSRVNYNLGYFSSNYAVVFVMLSIYSLLTNLTLLFVIALVIGGMYGIGKLQGNDLEIGSWRATTSQLYTGLLVVSVPLAIIASPFATVLWLIGASGVTILGHATFMDKPIESAFSEEAV